MAIMGDRYVAEFDGHRVELVRDNAIKTLDLFVDGARVASESRILPHDITLTAKFQGKSGATHEIIARAIVKGPHIGRFAIGIDVKDSIEIDGREVPLDKVQ
jgi:hypothetical protein